MAASSLSRIATRRAVRGFSLLELMFTLTVAAHSVRRRHTELRRHGPQQPRRGEHQRAFDGVRDRAQRGDPARCQRHGLPQLGRRHLRRELGRRLDHLRRQCGIRYGSTGSRPGSAGVGRNARHRDCHDVCERHLDRPRVGAFRARRRADRRPRCRSVSRSSSPAARASSCARSSSTPSAEPPSREAHAEHELAHCQGVSRGRPRSRSARVDQGFSLIEVLVALVVLSVGLLGLAALQSTAAQFNAGAYTRSQATILAYDIADRIRANRAAALNGDYTSAYAGRCRPRATRVVAGTVAQQDLGAWRRALACTLPSGNGAVACDGDWDGGSVLTISVPLGREPTDPANVPTIPNIRDENRAMNKHHALLRRRSAEAGLTLIELMVALMLGLILIGGAIQVFRLEPCRVRVQRRLLAPAGKRPLRARYDRLSRAARGILGLPLRRDDLQQPQRGHDACRSTSTRGSSATKPTARYRRRPSRRPPPIPRTRAPRRTGTRCCPPISTAA